MVEIRFHGRGGQGAVVASEILARALAEEGKHVQSFPSFGVERRGSPVAAFVRFDEEPILARYQIYEPDHIVVLEKNLLSEIDVTAGLKEGGWIVINSEERSFPAFSKFRVATVDANGIALKHGLGSKTAPIVNTAILGALARTTEIVAIQAVLEAINKSVPLKKDENVAAAKEAYEAVKIRSKMQEA